MQVNDLWSETGGGHRSKCHLRAGRLFPAEDSAFSHLLLIHSICIQEQICVYGDKTGQEEVWVQMGSEITSCKSSRPIGPWDACVFITVF